MKRKRTVTAKVYGTRARVTIEIESRSMSRQGSALAMSDLADRIMMVLAESPKIRANLSEMVIR